MPSRPWLPRSSRWALPLLAAALAGLLLAGAPPARAEPCPGADCTVEGDPDNAAYVGDGGLLLPGGSFTGSDQDRTDAAVCEGCRWALVPMCKRGGLGNGSCTPAARSCPAGEQRLEVFLRRPGEVDFSSVGLVCLSSAGPVTVSDVAERLHDVVVEQVPELRPSYQPAAATLVGLPTLFASGQPARLDTRRFSLVGFSIVLEARATWGWSFGDGEELVTLSPGGAFPDRSVSHVYRRAGSVTASVTTVWEGWFTVDGLGPFPVGGPQVSQSDVLPVAVREARAVLSSE